LAAQEFAAISPAHKNAAFGVVRCVAGMDTYARTPGYSHEQRQPTLEGRRPSNLEFIRAGRYANRPLSGSPLIRERVITIGEWWFESVAVPLVVTNEMQCAERAVGQVLQADEFEMHEG